jgi:hypothetical protein
MTCDIPYNPPAMRVGGAGGQGRRVTLSPVHAPSLASLLYVRWMSS